jgi:hypothetical protein
LTEEPDVWEIRLSGSAEGLGNNQGLKPREASVYSTEGGVFSGQNSHGYQRNSKLILTDPLAHDDASIFDFLNRQKIKSAHQKSQSKNFHPIPHLVPGRISKKEFWLTVLNTFEI